MDLTQFLELFNPYPGNKYLQVTTEVDATTDALYDLMKGANGEFALALYSQEQKEMIQRYPDATLQYLTTLTQPFRALPRDYDMVIFKDIFSKHHNPKGILKIAYTTLANAAHIIIMEKKGVLDVDATLQLLEEFEFRSQNSIDILPEYDLLMAKKLHMWGNGL